MMTYPSTTACRWCGSFTHPVTTKTAGGFDLETCVDCDGVVDARCTYVTFDGQPLVLMVKDRLLRDVRTGRTYSAEIAGLGTSRRVP